MRAARPVFGRNERAFDVNADHRARELRRFVDCPDQIGNAFRDVIEGLGNDRGAERGYACTPEIPRGGGDLLGACVPVVAVDAVVAVDLNVDQSRRDAQVFAAEFAILPRDGSGTWRQPPVVDIQLHLRAARAYLAYYSHCVITPRLSSTCMI